MTTRQPQAQFQSQGHLPPRCPIQKKPIHGSFHDSHNHSSSNHPTWLDDLLAGESDSNGGLRPLRRSVSDPVTLLDSVADSFAIQGPHNDEGNSGGSQTCGGLESASSMYGPNSPRLRSSSSFSESAIVSALSECVSEEQGQYMDGGLCVSRVDYSDVIADGEPNADARAAKRFGSQLTVKFVEINFCFMWIVAFLNIKSL